MRGRGPALPICLLHYRNQFLRGICGLGAQGHHAGLFAKANKFLMRWSISLKSKFPLIPVPSGSSVMSLRNLWRSANDRAVFGVYTIGDTCKRYID